MSRSLAGVLVLLALGLATVAATAPTSAPTSAPKEEWATFLMISGPDTLMRERFIRRPDQVEGLIVLGNRLMQGYTMNLGKRAAVTSVDVRLRPYPSLPESALVYITAGRRNGEVYVVSRNPDMRKNNTYKIGPEVQLGVAGSIAFLEQLVMRARVLGDKAMKIPVYLPATKKNWEAEIEPIGSDSMRVVMSGDEWRFEVDENGRLEGGETVRSRVRMTRVEAEN